MLMEPKQWEEVGGEQPSLGLHGLSSQAANEHWFTNRALGKSLGAEQ